MPDSGDDDRVARQSWRRRRTRCVGGGFADWIGASFIGKEQYATVDDRLLSYFSVNVAVRHPRGRCG